AVLAGGGSAGGGATALVSPGGGPGGGRRLRDVAVRRAGVREPARVDGCGRDRRLPGIRGPARSPVRRRPGALEERHHHRDPSVPRGRSGRPAPGDRRGPRDADRRRRGRGGRARVRRRALGGTDAVRDEHARVPPRRSGPGPRGRDRAGGEGARGAAPRGARGGPSLRVPGDGLDRRPRERGSPEASGGRPRLRGVVPGDGVPARADQPGRPGVRRVDARRARRGPPSRRRGHRRDRDPGDAGPHGRARARPPGGARARRGPRPRPGPPRSPDAFRRAHAIERDWRDPMKRFWLALPLVLALVATACTGGGGGGTATGSGGQIHLVMWMGYTPPPPANQSYEYLSIERMVKEVEKQNPNITIELQYVNSDYALQKATVAIQGNKQPDISYQYGTNMPQLAQSPKLVDLTSRVQSNGFNWDDFYPGERAVAT